MDKPEHISVLWQESLEALAIQPDGFYLDGTFGRGGHSRGVLKRLGPGGLLLAVDQDPQAEQEATKLQRELMSLGDDCAEFQFLRGRFSEVEKAVAQLNRPLMGVLLDLGVSSPQLDEAERGFSFQQSGPLDMRMDPHRGEPLQEKLLAVSDEDLANVLWTLGEERHSRRIAKAILLAQAEGRLNTTGELAEVIKAAHPKWQPGKHPATKSFLALRLWVNQELDELEKALRQFTELLAPGGRLVVISFHSLEDRIVKRFFKGQQESTPDIPPWVPVASGGGDKKNQHPLRVLIKGQKPSAEEQNRNSRARSAILRVAEKIESGREN